jgi:uncharacterized protein YcfL
MKMNRKTKVAVSVVAGFLALGALAGCQTPVAPEGGVRIDNQNTETPTLNTVRVIDNSLATYQGRSFKVKSVLDVEQVNVGTSATGFPNITVQLRNKSAGEIALEVRTSWFDASGRPVDPAKSWTRIFARPMSMVTYDQGSINQTAKQYFVEVRAAQ